MSRIAAAAMLAAALSAFATPAQADDRPKPSDATEQVIVVTDNGTCWVNRDASTTGRESSLRTAIGTAYRATPAVYRGTGIGRGEGVFRWLQVTPTQGCWVPGSFTTSDLPGSLDPSTWTGHGIVASASAAGTAGAILARRDKVLFSAPSFEASEIGKVDDGEVLATSGWIIEGEPVLSGVSEWRPVARDGVAAWLRATSMVDVPVYAESDLTSRLTPTRKVPVWTLPGAGEHLGDLLAGVTVPASLTATLGWIPVVVDGRVGWVSQKDLLSASTASPSAAPTDEPTEPGLIDRARDEYDDWKANTGADNTAAEGNGEPGFWQSLSDKVRGRNPVAEAAAKAALLLSGGLALPALLLAGAAYATTSAKRTSSVVAVVTQPWLLVARHMSLPAAIGVAGLAAWLTPRAYFVPQVLGGAGLVGVVLAAVVAHRLAVGRGADRNALVETARGRSTSLLVAALAVGGGAFLMTGGVAAVAVVAGLLAAGAAAGWSAPRSSVGEVAVRDAPAHLPSDGTTSVHPRSEEVR